MLWSGSAFATDQASNNNGGGLIGVLVSAAVKQIVNNLSDTSYPVAGIASVQLLTAGRQNGVLHGPRSPEFGKD